MAIDIYIEGQKLDLFDGDNISIQQKVKDADDITLKTDFSQSFSVPASKTNNLIFEHYYDYTVDDGFDARVRKTATIDIDTLDFKRGKIRLDSVKLKDQQPESYSLTFFGDAIKLKDEIGDDKLFDLTWLSNFDHDYTDTNVKTGLTTGLNFTFDGNTYTKAVIYPLISYKRQYMINSDSADTTSTDILVNIDYDAARSDGIDYRELKPAINVPLIFQAIEEEYGLTFTGNFFDREEFNQLYMNISTDAEELSAGYYLVEEVSGTGSFWFIYKYACTITPDAGFGSVGYKVRLTVNNTVVYESPNFLYGTQTVIGIADWASEYETKAEVFTEEDFDFAASTVFESNTTEYSNSYTGLSISLDVLMSEQLPDVKVYEFLTSFINMFNLIVTPQSDGSLYFNDYQSWLSEGEIYDISPYVDTSKTTVKRGKIYNEIKFLFQESDQVLAEEYRQQNRIGYGDIEERLTDLDGTPLDGGVLEKELIFENPVFERLTDQDTLAQTVVQYCLMMKGGDDISSYVGDPFLFYAPAVDISSETLGFVESGSTYVELSNNVFMPSHSMQIDTTSFNINFGAVVNEYSGGVYTDTLYDRYYSDYISDVFSIKRRMIQIESILPLNLLHRLKLNDRLIVNDTRFIINSIDSNLTNRRDKLELINDIFEAPLASDELNTSLFRRTFGIYNNTAQTDSVNYIGLDNKTASLVDTGDGTSWASLGRPKSEGSSSEITFTLLANSSGSQRSMQVQVTDGLKNPKFTIIQEE